ncbi:MAG: thioredoxin-disulfide reductase [Alphaproteobacteria bacterium]|nr:thioredoxin-disulfide reductase [Alphaproteobacteria bacterium]
MMTADVLIIGSGPAGYTAAIYAARAGRTVCLIAGAQLGGQLIITPSIENYPGFAKPISGTELMEQMRMQVESMEVQIICDTIETVDFSKVPFKTVSETGQIYEGKTIIIATGATAKWLQIPGETKYRGRGVSACATCDGFFFKNKDVVVVGGGNVAIEDAIFLTNFAKSVTLVHRRDELRAEKILQKRFFDNPKAKIIWNSVVTEIIGDDSQVTKLKLRNVKDESISYIDTNGVFVAIGHQPNTSIFRGQIELDEIGYVTTQTGSILTSIDGIFAAGDVCDSIYKQAITSAAQGCMAGIEADRFLARHGFV